MVTETKDRVIVEDAVRTAEPVPSDRWLEDLLGPLSLEMEEETEIRESMKLLPDQCFRSYLVPVAERSEFAALFLHLFVRRYFGLKFEIMLSAYVISTPDP